MLTEQQKEQAVQQVEHYLRTTNTPQANFAKMADINQSYLSLMLNRKWNEMNAGNGKTVELHDKYFEKVLKAAVLDDRENVWQHIDTDNYLYCISTFNLARISRMPILVDGDTGLGKTYAAKRYLKENPNETYLVTCAGDLTPKMFMLELAEAVGIAIGETSGQAKIRKMVCSRLKRMERPLLIIDESENLKDGSWDSIKTILDDLKGYCGVVTLGAYIDKRLQRRSDNAKGNFAQIYRRYKEGGIRKLLPLEKMDIKLVCDTLHISDAKVQRLLFDHCRNWGELSGAINTIFNHAKGEAITHDLAKQALDI